MTEENKPIRISVKDAMLISPKGKKIRISFTVDCLDGKAILKGDSIATTRLLMDKDDVYLERFQSAVSQYPGKTKQEVLKIVSEQIGKLKGNVKIDGS